MIGLLPTTTIFLATAPTDLRKAYDGRAHFMGRPIPSLLLDSS